MAGRPKLDARERLAVGLRVRVTEGERATLNEAAASEGKGLSDYMRARLLLAPQAPRRNQKAADLMRALDSAALESARIGNNLNQIAHTLNATGRLRNLPELQRVIAEIERIAAKHMAAIDRVIGL